MDLVARQALFTVALFGIGCAGGLREEPKHEAPPRPVPQVGAPTAAPIALPPPAPPAAIAGPWPAGLCGADEHGAACLDAASAADRTGDARTAMALLWRGCALEEPEACEALGGRIRDGKAPGWDAERALAEAKAGCGRSPADGAACLAAAQLLAFGLGVAEDADAAHALYARACEVAAWTCSGLADDTAAEDAQGVAAARAAYERACNQKPGRGCRALGDFVAEQDGAAAGRAYGRGCDAGDAAACLRLAEVLVARAPELQQRACDGGVVGACTAAAVELEKTSPAVATPLWERACGAGVAAACGYLGKHLLLGTGVVADPARADALLDASCQGGEVAACTLLGMVLESGKFPGLARNPARERALFDKACAGGEVNACGALGVMLVKGMAGAADVAGGTALVRRACEAGRAESCADLAILSKDPREAKDLRARACKGGVEAACAADKPAGAGKHELPPHPVDVADKLCREGNGAACLREAELAYPDVLAAGIAAVTKPAVPTAPRTAPLRPEAELLARGCDLGAAEACVRVAGLTQDGAKKEQALQRACDLGLGKACGDLAHRIDGAATPDLARSFKVKKRGCELHDGSSCVLVGWSYQGGRGTARDLPAALRAFTESCDLHVDVACEEAGALYENGADGVAADRALARKFYGRACHGDSSRRACQKRDALK